MRIARCRSFTLGGGGGGGWKGEGGREVKELREGCKLSRISANL